MDGSIKDIAAAKDCPIHTITPEERDRVLTELFSNKPDMLKWLASQGLKNGSRFASLAAHPPDVNL